MRQAKRKRLIEKKIQVGSIYFVKNDTFFNKEKPPEEFFDRIVLPTIYWEALDNRIVLSPQEKQEIQEIKRVWEEHQVRCRTYSYQGNLHVKKDTTLLLISKDVISANKKTCREQQLVFQFLLNDKPAWWWTPACTRRARGEGYPMSFLNCFHLIRAGVSQK